MIKRIDLNKYIYVSLIILIIGLPTIKFISYICYFSGIVTNSFTVNHVYVLWLLIPLLLFNYIYGLIKHKFHISTSDVLIYILIILSLLSTINSVNTSTSIWGAYNRNEGFITLMSYYLIFLNAKNLTNKKYLNNLIELFMFVGIFQLFYAFLQVYTQLPFIKHYTIPYLGMGLCSNPNFFGSYMVVLTLLSFVFYLLKGNKSYFVYTLLFYTGICLSGSTGPLIGFILGITFFIIYYRKKIDIKKVIITLSSFVIIFFLVDFTIYVCHNLLFKNVIDNNYSIKKETVETLKIINNKSSSSIDRLGNGRIGLWMSLLPLTKKYWLIGSGLDTIAYICPYVDGLIFDKAHNIYLQILLTNGIFSLITYCLLCLNIFIKGFKFKDNFKIALYIVFIGYSVQAFGNISVIEVAPYFYMILGMLFNDRTIT